MINQRLGGLHVSGLVLLLDYLQFSLGVKLRGVQAFFHFFIGQILFACKYILFFGNPPHFKARHLTSRISPLASCFLLLASSFFFPPSLFHPFVASLKNASFVPAPALQLALRAQTVGLTAPPSGAFLAHRLRFERGREKANA